MVVFVLSGRLSVQYKELIESVPRIRPDFLVAEHAYKPPTLASRHSGVTKIAEPANPSFWNSSRASSCFL